VSVAHGPRISSQAGLNAVPLALLALSLVGTGCDAGHASPGAGGAAAAAAGQSSTGGGGAPAGSAGQAAGGETGATEAVLVSAKTRTPVTTTRSVNYWMWTPTWGDPVSGTDAQVAPLAFELMRIGGYNNDANTPDPFDNAQLDRIAMDFYVISLQLGIVRFVFTFSLRRHHLIDRHQARLRKP